MADTMDLKLDGDVIRKLVSEAVLQTLDANKREILIKGAIEHLLRPSTNGYGNAGASPLQEAFNTAIRDTARELARDELAKDPRIKEKIRELFETAWTRLTSPPNDGWEKMIDSVVDAIRKTMTGERY